MIFRDHKDKILVFKDLKFIPTFKDMENLTLVLVLLNLFNELRKR